MHKVEQLRRRLGELQSRQGWITLSDGTRFAVKDSGIHMLYDATKLRRDLRREPLLTDFPEEEQAQWQAYAKWDPDPSEHGQISLLLVEMAKKIVARSNAS